MKTLTRYILKQVTQNLCVGVATMTLVFLLGNAMREIITILSRSQIPLGVAFQALLMLIPFVLVYTLPIGFLTATLLVFGRMSSDNEITAARANGFSVASLATPLIIYSFVFSALCAWVNLDLGPKARYMYKRIIHEYGSSNIGAFIPEKVFITQKNFILYVGRKDGNTLYDVKYFQMGSNDSQQLDFIAKRAEILEDEDSFTIRFHEPYTLAKKSSRAGDFQHQIGGPNSTETVTLAKGGAGGPALAGPERSEMGFRQLLDYQAKIRELGDAQAELNAIQVSIQERLAFGLSSCAFTLIGIPLGIRTQRRESSAGILGALILMLIYYAFIILAKSLESQPHLFPSLIVWIPNLIFCAVGLGLIRKLDRA